MKLTTDKPFADPGKAARRLMQHAHAFEIVQEEKLGPFLYFDRGTPAGCSAGLACAIEHGWLTMLEAEPSSALPKAGAIYSCDRRGFNLQERGRQRSRTGAHPQSDLEPSPTPSWALI
jgi:hypothetical protein